MYKKEVRWLIAAVMVIVTGAACVVPGLGGQVPAPTVAVPTPSGDGSGAVPTPLPADILAQADAEEQLLINIYQRVIPSVVNIDLSATGDNGQLADYASGSGFVYDTEGHIITNAHVVSGADEIRVTFNDGAVMVADLVGADQYADIAVIQVHPPEGYTLYPVEIGDSSTVVVGQRVIAIGNPFGLSGSMTVGIVSGVGRTLPSEATNSEGGVFSNPLIIQTDASINPGNSGGPLLNSQGEVIGVNAAIRSETGVNSGIGFAIPVNTVSLVAPQLIETGEVAYPYLGISAQSDFTLAELAVEFDLPVTEGVLIASVADGSGAAQAGLRGGRETATFRGAEVALGGDIIVAVDGVPIHNFDELLGYLVSNTRAGQTITVTIIRDGETLDVPVTLGERPSG